MLLLKFTIIFKIILPLIYLFTLELSFTLIVAKKWAQIIQF